MKHWYEIERDLLAAIQKRFPKSKEDIATKWTRAICEEAMLAQSLQWIERSDTKPLDDKEAIKKAAKNLRQAAKQLEKLGWHGMGALSDMGEKAFNVEHDFPGRPVLTRQEALDHLVRQLSGFADELTKRESYINETDGSVLASLDPDKFQGASSGRTRGRPAETIAYRTALKAYDAFAVLSRTRPTVSTNPHSFGNKAYGPFLEFLKSIFSCLGIQASHEAWAREACKEKNAQSS